MNLVPPDFPSGMAWGPGYSISTCGAGSNPSTRDSLEAKWAVLHQAAAVVCTLAGEEQEAASPEILDFPAAISTTGGRRVLAESGIDDLIAVMELGISALLAVNGGGGDAAPPARALRREFLTARNSLLALLPLA